MDIPKRCSDKTPQEIQEGGTVVMMQLERRPAQVSDDLLSSPTLRSAWRVASLGSVRRQTSIERLRVHMRPAATTQRKHSQDPPI